MVILKVEVAAALAAFSALALEHRAAHFVRDRLAPAPQHRSLAFLDVEQHVRAVQPLRRSSLTISDQGQHIPLTVPTGLPVERVLEPPPDAATRLGYWYRSLSPGGIELPVLLRGDPSRRAACSCEPEAPPEQEPAVKDESRVRVLPQLHAAGCGCSPREGRCRGHPDDR